MRHYLRMYRAPAEYLWGPGVTAINNAVEAPGKVIPAKLHVPSDRSFVLRFTHTVCGHRTTDLRFALGCALIRLGQLQRNPLDRR